MFPHITVRFCIRPAMAAVTLALCLLGCQASNSAETNRKDMMLTVGGIFWPDATPGFETDTSDVPVVSIPAGSECDIRELSSGNIGRSKVKVLVNHQWHLVWVDPIKSLDFDGVIYIPFDTFAYITSGSEDSPDRNWEQTLSSLKVAAREKRAELTEEALRDLLGEKTVAVFRANASKIN